MEPSLRQKFKALLLGLPVWGKTSSRMAFLQDVFHGHPLLENLTDERAPADAATELLGQLDGFDAPGVDGLTPACSLLKAVREKFGAGPKRGPVLAELERSLCQPALGEPLGEPHPLPSVASVDQLRSILYLAANPEDKDLDLLRTDREFKAIRDALSASEKRRDITLQLPEFALGRHDLTKALLATEPSVVHFSGHGAGDDGILFEDEQGRAKSVSAEALGSVFRLFGHCVKVVVLNACYSAIQAEAIAAHIHYVIGTREAIGDDAAIDFSIGFYRALAAGWSVEDAFQFGCAEMRMGDIPEHAIPVLMTGPGKVTSCAD